ncbi:MAG: Mrp/NBP35 family ATP-binding protein [Candidatus Helarchaeota archaeon]|nr:Mrp/NBP35 family ATP-binding protein [Candidatus Helarchaeota archaeon]
MDEKEVEQREASQAKEQLEAQFKKQLEAEHEFISKKMKNIRYRIVVLSGKGGVGKTTVAVNLVTALALNGLRVGLLDADIHGPNAPKMLGIKRFVPNVGESGIQPAIGPLNTKVMSMDFLLPNPDTPIIWRGPLKMGAIKQFITDVNWGELDYLIVDLPPGTGDEPLSILQLIPNITGVIIVTTPQDVSLLDVRKSITMVKEMNVPILGIVENMAGFICPSCGAKSNIFGEGGGQKAAKDMNISFLGGIPIDENVTRDGDKGLPFVVQDAKSQATIAFKEITDNIRRKIEPGYKG